MELDEDFQQTSPAERVLRMREAGNVRRCHGLPHHGEYTIGKHSWDAVMLLYTCYPGEPSAALVRAVLLHDTAERWVGDLPSPALRKWPDLGRAYRDAEISIHNVLHGYDPEVAGLTNEERRWLKGVDRVELWLWCQDQMALGNKNAGNWSDGLERTFQVDGLLPELKQLVDTYRWRRTSNIEVTG